VRSELNDLNGRSFDVAIIGGGINGCAAAQHLAAAGYQVLLVERNDLPVAQPAGRDGSYIAACASSRQRRTFGNSCVRQANFG